MIVCDTGPIVAAAIKNDVRHRECVDLFTALHLAGRRILVPGTVIAVCERLGLTEVASLDGRHFTVVRPRHVKALTLLPE
ncbi:MAG TPA: hypothetical protein VE074_11320 [Jatrophihabitantaceae bacterium]|nr:hypothetical protein [Jatrophihabitantaceae bacterium]